jgi:hypothetical protein
MRLKGNAQLFQLLKRPFSTGRSLSLPMMTATFFMKVETSFAVRQTKERRLSNPLNGALLQLLVPGKKENPS